MQKTMFKISLALLMVFSLSSTAMATNIAAFSAVEVMQKSAIAKAAQAEIQKKFGGEGEKLEKEFAALQKEAADFQKQVPALSEAARMAKAQELDTKGRAFEEKRANLAQNMTPFQKSIEAQIQDTLITACENYAKANNLDMILEAANIAFLTPTSNVTNAIIAEMDKIWKSKGSKFK